MKHTPEILHSSAIGRFVEAYRNPRLQDPDTDYLNTEHIEELRDLSEIRAWQEIGEPEVYEGIGTIHRASFVTKQGYGYEADICSPTTQRGDSLGLVTGPLGTSRDGFNLHLMLNYMRAGNYVAFISGDGTHPLDNPRKAMARISLASTAATLLNVGYHVGSELSKEGHSIDEKKRFTYGPSHAGAVAILLNILDSEFEQDVRSSDVIAPSPALKLESMPQWWQVAEQVSKEPAQTAFIISRLGLKLALRYRKSLGYNMEHLARQIELCGGIFNGELDTAATRVPTDKVIRITEYDCDLVCNDGGLEQRLTSSTHPNVSFEQLHGIHMSIADRHKTLPIMMGFNKAYQEYENGLVPSPEVLFARARELAPRQFPITKSQVPTSLDQKVA